MKFRFSKIMSKLLKIISKLLKILSKFQKIMAPIAHKFQHFLHHDKSAQIAQFPALQLKCVNRWILCITPKVVFTTTIDLQDCIGSRKPAQVVAYGYSQRSLIWHGTLNLESLWPEYCVSHRIFQINSLVLTIASHNSGTESVGNN